MFAASAAECVLTAEGCVGYQSPFRGIISGFPALRANLWYMAGTIVASSG